MPNQMNPHEEMWRGFLTDPESPLHSDRKKFNFLPGSPRCKPASFRWGRISRACRACAKGQVNLTSRPVSSIVSSVLDSLTERAPVQAQNDTGEYVDSIKASARLMLWTLAWVATLAFAKFGPDFLWDSQQTVASWAAVAFNLVVGIGWIVAFTRFLREADELQRKIVQDALAAALGVGWIGGFAYVVADGAGLVDYDVNIAVLPTLLGVVYMIAILVGTIRYR